MLSMPNLHTPWYHLVLCVDTLHLLLLNVFVLIKT